MTSNQTPTALQQFFMALIRSNGVDIPKHPILNFLGGTVVEDLPNNQILITLGGGGGASFANLTANFNQPAVGAQQVAQVSLSSSYQVGATVFILGGGFYTVFAVPDSTHLTLTNTGAKGNAAPSATVTSGPLVIPSGPGPLLLQNNGAPITLRTFLDLVGFGYTDDAVNDRMIFTAGGGIGAEVAVAPGSSGTLSQVVSQMLVVDTTGARPIRTMPAAPNDHDIVRVTCVGSTNNLGAEFRPNTGQTIGDPSNPGTFSSVRGVAFAVGWTGGWFYQLANTRWVAFS